MTKITNKKVAMLLPLVAVMGLAITAISAEQAFAFNLSENTDEPTVTRIIFIVSDQPGDCDDMGQWDQTNKSCIINSQMTIGVNDRVIVQSNAVLEISKTATITLYGTIENRGNYQSSWFDVQPW